MHETIYLATLIGTVLVLVAGFSSLLAYRFGAPLLLLFLCIGLAAGEDGLGIRFDNGALAYFIGSIALAVILFDSGFGTPLRSFRQAAAPAVTLATVGVLITAGLFGGFAAWLLGIGWLEGVLLGAIVGSTDAAAVFFLLRIGGINIRDRVRSTLEIESGSNDPMAIFLTIALVELLAAGEGWGEIGIGILFGFLQQMGIGLAAGLAGGWMMAAIINRLSLDRGLVPILAIALAMLVFALAGVAHGSGFLAVYVAGLVAGNRRIRGSATLKTFQEGMTWLFQIIMFLVLGLLAAPSQFPAIALDAVLMAGFLILVARPLAVWLCLLPFDFQARETAFVSWVGLRGAVSILLAILPVLGGLPVGGVFFNSAFLIVLVSLLFQGWTLGWVARRLGLILPKQIGPLEKFELELPGSAHHELLSYRVVADSPVAKGERVPRWARPSLVIRNGQSMRYQYAGRLQAGDYVYLFISPRYPRLLDRLFASPAPVEPDDEEFFGAFSVEPGRPAELLESAYGCTLSEDERQMSVAEMMVARLGGRAEFGDRVPLAPVELIVRDTGMEGAITAVGLSLEPETTRPHLPFHLSRAALLAFLRRRRRRRAPVAALPASPLLAERQAVLTAAAEAASAPSGSPSPNEGTPTMNAFRTLDDADVAGKRVLTRVDLNVPMKDGRVTDATRIERILPTIRELADKGARVVLLAHFGRPKGKPDPAQSLEPIAAALSEKLGRPVGFAADCVGPVADGIVASLRDGDVVLLENTRFHEGEERNEEDFVSKLASLGDVFVNDAFSAAHRAHASTEGLAHHLPSYAGRTMQAELEALEKGLGKPERPVVAIVGGAKVSTKIDLLRNLVAKVDALVIGGGMANTFLAAQGVDVGKSLCEHDLAETALAILDAAKAADCAIVLPLDGVVAREFKANAANETVVVEAIPSDAMMLDVGPRSVEAVNGWIDRAKTLVWNGPLGAFEIAPFDAATVSAARHAAERTKTGALVSVAGGGDTVAALNHAGVGDDFTYVSTAGGAFLEWMEGKPLPGVDVLKV